MMGHCEPRKSLRNYRDGSLSRGTQVAQVVVNNLHFDSTSVVVSQIKRFHSFSPLFIHPCAQRSAGRLRRESLLRGGLCVFQAEKAAIFPSQGVSAFPGSDETLTEL